MKPLATEILHEVKKKLLFWKVTTIVCLTLAVVEFITIIF